MLLDVKIILFASLLFSCSSNYGVETFQLMTNEGISELLFISDGIWQMEASFYPELPGGEKENMNHQMSLCSDLKELATVQIEDKQTNPL